MQRDQQIVAILSRISAVVSFLGGLAILGFLLLLTLLWPTRAFLGELLALLREPPFIGFLLCAVVAMALAPFIWRERIWAMAAALALSGSFLFMFGNETLFLKILLSGITGLFAICIGVRHWLGRAAAR
jgi:hypothetical protein